MFRRFISAFITVAALAPVVGRAQIIDTRPPGQEFFFANWSNGVMLGESFTTPGGTSTTLSALTLYDVKVKSGEPLTYSAFVSQWNPVTRMTGAQVWSTSGSDLSTVYTDLSFAVNTNLAGGSYIFALFVDAANGNFFMGDTPYGGGNFYFQSGNNPGGVWSNQWAAYDLEFSAQFVPEPGTLLLLASGLMGLVGLAVSRRDLVA